MRMPKVLAGLVTTVAAAGLVGAGGAPASAEIALVHCVGSQVTDFSPGLTGTAKATNIAETTAYNVCLSTNPGVRSAFRVTFSVSPSRSCKDVGVTQAVRYSIGWSNGQSSTIEGTATTVVAVTAFAIVVTGRVTGGLFTGAQVLQTVTGVDRSILLCTAGLEAVTRLTGPANLTLLSV